METVAWMLLALAALVFAALVGCSLVAREREAQRGARRRRELAAMSSAELCAEARRIAAAHYAHEAATHPLLDDELEGDAALLARLEALFRECHAAGGASADEHLVAHGLVAVRDVLRCRLRLRSCRD